MTTALEMIELVLAALVVAGEWMMLKKMGEKGWKALVPFYGTYLIFKHIWNKKMFWVLLASSLTLGVMEGLLRLPALTENLPFALVALVVSAVAAVVLIVVEIKAFHKLAQAFGHGLGYTLGLIFAHPVFSMMLGFGKSEFVAA